MVYDLYLIPLICHQLKQLLLSLQRLHSIYTKELSKPHLQYILHGTLPHILDRYLFLSFPSEWQLFNFCQPEMPTFHQFWEKFTLELSHSPYFDKIYCFRALQRNVSQQKLKLKHLTTSTDTSMSIEYCKKRIFFIGERGNC